MSTFGYIRETINFIRNCIALVDEEQYSKLKDKMDKIIDQNEFYQKELKRIQKERDEEKKEAKENLDKKEKELQEIKEELKNTQKSWKDLMKIVQELLKSNIKNNKKNEERFEEIRQMLGNSRIQHNTIASSNEGTFYSPEDLDRIPRRLVDHDDSEKESLGTDKSIFSINSKEITRDDKIEKDKKNMEQDIEGVHVEFSDAGAKVTFQVRSFDVEVIIGYGENYPFEKPTVKFSSEHQTQENQSLSSLDFYEVTKLEWKSNMKLKALLKEIRSMLRIVLPK